jgi:hypothetical protein
VSNGVVKDAGRDALEAGHFCKAPDHSGDVVERVAEFISRRHVRLIEPREVTRDDWQSVGEQRDQIAKHVARARKAVQEQ